MYLYLYLYIYIYNDFKMNLSCVMRRSTVARNRLKIPTVAVGRM